MNGTNSEFGDRIYYKSNLIFVFEDTNGNKFGHYLKEKIRETWDFVVDENAFVFSLKSNGRLEGMMKFDIKEEDEAFELYDEDNRVGYIEKKFIVKPGGN